MNFSEKPVEIRRFTWIKGKAFWGEETAKATHPGFLSNGQEAITAQAK
jgi:hypothetical protein